MSNRITSTIVGLLITSSLLLISCSPQSTTQTTNTRDTIYIDNGADAPTLDPHKSEDVISSRVIYDLFEGLTSFDQKKQIIPGLAESWVISPDGKTYIFYLRPNIKFSDGTPITADDVVFTFQRLADPKTAAPYSTFAELLINGKDVIKAKRRINELGIEALDDKTIKISLVNPEPAFLEICSKPNLGIVSKHNISKFDQQWTKPKNMIGSGAYRLTEQVIKGHLLLEKNPFYYDHAAVAIDKVKILPIEDTNSSLSQYKSGTIDVTYSIPVDQYAKIKAEMGNQLHTVTKEALYYYDFNMLSPKFKDNPKLRQALTMAIDRETLVNKILGQGQVPSYSYATATIDNAKFADLSYDWAKLPRSEQIAIAKKLFAEAGYSSKKPFEINLQYNTNDLHKKVAIATSSMWQEVFGAQSIKVNLSNQEWKTFIDSKNKGNFEIARSGWNADYNKVGTYAELYLCNSNQNKTKYCNMEYNKLIMQAQALTDENKRDELIRQALKIAMNDYSIIPMFQYTYFRLINPKVVGYIPEDNHFDHVMSKWYRFK